MPVNQSLDQFFQDKEHQREPDLGQMQQHWQQMQQLLAAPPPAVAPVGKGLLAKCVLGLLGVGVVAGALWWLSAVKSNTPASAANYNTVAQETATPFIQNNPPTPGPVETPVLPAPVAKSVAPQEADKKDIDKKERKTPVAKPAKAAQTDAESFDDFYIQLSRAPQMFTVNTAADTLLRCAEGSRVIIPANVFVDANGQKANGPISVIVQEYCRYDKTAGRAKEITASMVKVEAYKGEEHLRIQPGQSIEIQMHPAIDKSNLERNRAANSHNGDLMPAPATLTTKTISTLGWISEHNAANDKRPRTNLVVRFQKEHDPQKFISQLAFTELGAVMPGYIEGREITFSNVPVGETVFLVSLGTVNGKHLCCIKKIIIGQSVVTDIRFTETSAEKFRQQSELLGSLPVKE
jgi:hypothetical protein